MASDNTVTLVGNLTRDPELRQTPSGLSVCTLRIAVNNRRKNAQTGEWIEEPNLLGVAPGEEPCKLVLRERGTRAELPKAFIFECLARVVSGV